MNRNSNKKLDYLAVLDFEATCEDRSSKSEFDISKQEIIEIPVGLISLEQGIVVDRFHSFVKPTIQPQLTKFCSELTSIQQADVDSADQVDQVIKNLIQWLKTNEANEHNTLFVTCGDWDLASMWPKQTALHPSLNVPGYFKEWANLKGIFRSYSGKKPGGMMSMLQQLKIPHEGHHHSGEDDVTNLCNIVLHLLKKNVQFEATSKAK